MARAKLSTFLRRLTRGMVAETLADQSDRELVERFFAGQDAAVFEAIVRRHGPMVYRVCWRVLQHHQDAEDAFQATFLVLAQGLRSVRKHASLASWLHGVAHRVALKAKSAAARRRRHEQQAPVSETIPSDEVSWVEVRAVLDAALAGLPEKWRLPLVLCYLEGQTQDEAAAQLGWSKRTLRRRLDEGRADLGRRLARRGVVWPAALAAVLVSDSLASAALSHGLLDSTIKAASLFAAGQTAAGLISAKAAALSEGVFNTMLHSKIKVAFAVLLLVIFLTSAGVLGRHRAAAQQPGTGQVNPAEPPPSEAPSWLQHLQARGWVLHAVDAQKETLSVGFDSTAGQIGRFVDGDGGKPGWFRREGVTGLDLIDVPVAKGARIIVDGEAATLAGLKAGMRLTLRFSPDRLTVMWINAVSPHSASVYILSAVDAQKRTLTVTNSDRQTMKSLPLAKDAKLHESLISLEGRPAKTVNLKLSDLKPGMHLVLQLGIVDGELVIRDLRAGP